MGGEKNPGGNFLGPFIPFVYLALLWQQWFLGAGQPLPKADLKKGPPAKTIVELGVCRAKKPSAQDCRERLSPNFVGFPGQLFHSVRGLPREEENRGKIFPGVGLIAPREKDPVPATVGGGTSFSGRSPRQPEEWSGVFPWLGKNRGFLLMR